MSLREKCQILAKIANKGLRCQDGDRRRPHAHGGTDEAPGWVHAPGAPVPRALSADSVL